MGLSGLGRELQGGGDHSPRWAILLPESHPSFYVSRKILPDLLLSFPLLKQHSSFACVPGTTVPTRTHDARRWKRAFLQKLVYSITHIHLNPEITLELSGGNFKRFTFGHYIQPIISECLELPPRAWDVSPSLPSYTPLKRVGSPVEVAGSSTAREELGKLKTYDLWPQKRIGPRERKWLCVNTTQNNLEFIPYGNCKPLKDFKPEVDIKFLCKNGYFTAVRTLNQWSAD